MKFQAFLQLDQFQLYGGGSVASTIDILLEHIDDSMVAEKACAVLKDKAWDPMKRLEFMDIPDIMTHLRTMVSIHQKNARVMVQSVEMMKFFFERGLMNERDERFGQLLEVTTITILGAIDNVQVWEHHQWITLMDLVKSAAAVPQGMALLKDKYVRRHIAEKYVQLGRTVKLMTEEVLALIEKGPLDM